MDRGSLLDDGFANSWALEFDALELPPERDDEEPSLFWLEPLPGDDVGPIDRST